MMSRPSRTWIPLAAVLSLFVGIGLAWHGPGHIRATTLAGEAVKADMPAFFTAGIETVAHCAADPDLFRLRDNPELRDAEVPEHFIDLELLESEKLPRTRSEFVALCARRKLDPAKVGALPYAIVEWTQRLTIALAEHRRWPDNPHIRAKCLVYAGLLSHYAQDACQPLHTTIHYDGKAAADGTSPRSGIHAKADALIQKAPAPAPAHKAKPAAFDDLFASVVARVRDSHRLVEEVYQIGDAFSVLDGEAPLPAGSPAAAFASERLTACADFTASLYLTAWRNSAKLELPEWHKR